MQQLRGGGEVPAGSAWCRATGVLKPNDSEQIHFLPFRVKIDIKARKDTGDLENVKEHLFGDELAALIGYIKLDS